MYKVFIRYRDEFYRFLNFEFRDHADGSLYIVFDRESRGAQRIDWNPLSGVRNDAILNSNEKFRISYHTTGKVNFHGTKAPPLFGEPVYSITRPQALACISVPEPASLTPAAERDVAFHTVDLPTEAEGRLTVHLAIMPPGVNPGPGSLAVVSFEGWFGIAVLLVPLPIEIPPDMALHTIKIAASHGRYTSTCVGRDEALIAFHRKHAGLPQHSMVTSWQPRTGVYRIIHSLPMRLPPRPTIRFKTPGLEACVDRVTCSETCFRVRGPGGFIKSHPEPITSVELSAEL